MLYSIYFHVQEFIDLFFFTIPLLPVILAVAFILLAIYKMADVIETLFERRKKRGRENAVKTPAKDSPAYNSEGA